MKVIIVCEECGCSFKGEDSLMRVSTMKGREYFCGFTFCESCFKKIFDKYREPNGLKQVSGHPVNLDKSPRW